MRKIKVEKKQGKKNRKDSRSESHRQKMSARETETINVRKRGRDGWRKNGVGRGRRGLILPGLCYKRCCRVGRER